MLFKGPDDQPARCVVIIWTTLVTERHPVSTSRLGPSDRRRDVSKDSRKRMAVDKITLLIVLFVLNAPHVNVIKIYPTKVTRKSKPFSIMILL